MKALLKKLNLPYKDESLYVMAMTHASYAYENQTEKNEKLEFLGDAVIELLMSDYLYNEDLDNEGIMTKKRAQAVCEEALVKYASKIKLADYIKLGKGEQLKGANSSMIADAFEALFGAIYLDLGYHETHRVFNKIVVPNFNLVWDIKDYKSSLQELIQAGDKRNISYQIIREKGPSHNREFESVVKLDNHIILGVGKGKTKKEAEQNAAHDALKKGNYDSKEIV
ncbi:MAG: ribonuclease III [Acholeplasmataceae bacterium]|nr:ribonuclease III [Acholeplasmataceae bacterium]